MYREILINDSLVKPKSVYTSATSGEIGECYTVYTLKSKKVNLLTKCVKSK